jgi:hypothetical protein
VFCAQQVEIPLPHMIESTVHLQDRISLPMRAVVISSGDRRNISSMDKANVRWVTEAVVADIKPQQRICHLRVSSDRYGRSLDLSSARLVICLIILPMSDSLMIRFPIFGSRTSGLPTDESVVSVFSV